MPCFWSPNAYYAADVATFVGSTPSTILGEITTGMSAGGLVHV
jgi:hypothetical protein